MRPYFVLVLVNYRSVYSPPVEYTLGIQTTSESGDRLEWNVLGDGNPIGTFMITPNGIGWRATGNEHFILVRWDAVGDSFDNLLNGGRAEEVE